jgi:general secretion pathway protein I
MDRFLTPRQPSGCRQLTRHGFTLLEVMVALAVLSIALTSIYRLQGQTFLMSGSARFYNLAPQLALEKLAETERLPFKDIIGGSGDFGEDFPNYRWTTAVEELPSELTEGNPYHLARIEVTVAFNEEYTYQLRTYRYYVD